jgi:hypothetical protein
MAAALRDDPETWRHLTEVLGFAPEVITDLRLGLYVSDGRRWLAYPYQHAGAWTFANCRALEGNKDFRRIPSGQPTTLYRADTLEPGGTAIVLEGERDVAAALTLGLGAEVGGSAGAAIVGMPGANQVSVAADALAHQSAVYLFTDADGAGDKAAEEIASRIGKDRCRRVRLEGFKDLGDLLSANGSGEARVHAVAALRAASAPPETQGVRLLRANLARFTVADLHSTPPPQRFILHPYIPAGTVSTLAGPGGSNKTTLTTYLAVCRALGRPFFGGTVPARGKTVILTTEDSRDDYLRKLAALREELGDGFDPQAISERVILFNLPGVPVRLVGAEGGNFRPTELADDLAAVLKADVLRGEPPGSGLVVMETVSRLAGGIETNESLSILVESAQRVCRLADVAVLLVAHVSQEAARQGHADGYAPRGGSALGDNGRSTLVLTRVNKNNRTEFAPDADLPPELMERLLVLTHPKSNGAPSAKPLLLERCSSAHGPVLRPATLRPREVDPMEQLHRLRDAVGKLTAAGIEPTERKLRGYAADIGCAEKRLGRLLDDACGRGILRVVGPSRRGGGDVYGVTE